MARRTWKICSECGKSVGASWDALLFWAMLSLVLPLLILCFATWFAAGVAFTIAALFCENPFLALMGVPFAGAGWVCTRIMWRNFAEPPPWREHRCHEAGTVTQVSGGWVRPFFVTILTVGLLWLGWVGVDSVAVQHACGSDWFTFLLTQALALAYLWKLAQTLRTP